MQSTIRARQSIRHRIALSATGLVLAVVAVIAGAAYLEARRTAVDSATRRLDDVSRRVSDMLGNSAAGILAGIARPASEAPLPTFLNDPRPSTKNAAIEALAAIPSQGTSVEDVELWDAAGMRLLAVPDSVSPLSPKDAEILVARLGEGGDSAAVGPITGKSEHLEFSVIRRIGPAAAPLGYLVQRRLLAMSRTSTSEIRDLIGSGADFVIGNTNGALWNDFTKLVPPVPAVRGGKTIVDYERPVGRAVLATIMPVPRTPWTIAIEFPRDEIFAPVRTMLKHLALFTVVLLLVATAGAWAASARLTRPIARLAAAADGMSAGNYTERVDVGRDDEIAALGTAFNTMADRVTLSRDSLQRKIVELERADARSRMLFDASPQPMWVSDAESLRFLAVNNVALERYGYTRDEFLAMTILDIRPAEHTPTENAIAMAPTTSLTESRVLRHRKKDGTIIEVEINSRPLDIGDRRAYLSLVTDLTTRRRAEESLRAAQHRLARVLGSSGAVLYELRLEETGAVLEWISENLTAMLGYEMHEVRDERWWTDNVHPADRARIGIRLHADTPRNEAVEYRFRHKDGHYRLLREDRRLIARESGGPAKIICAWMDVTEQRQLESQFRQAQKMEAIGRLAGGVAHDFNNLLTVIIAECQYLQATNELSDAERGDCVEQIEKAADRAANLTRQLLTFSRRQLTEPAAVDLNSIVVDIDKMLRRLIGEDVDLRVELLREPVVTMADRGQLEQVIVNLAVNARDAMPVGGTLTIATARTTLDQAYAESHPDVKPGEYVMLTVSDTGIGMDDEIKSHIFEPFFSTKDDGKGTGLGLATSYAIARQFGGHIAAYSELGFGTTMRVYLPSTESSVVFEQPLLPDNEPGTETILLVEDDEQVRRLTARTLQARGYTVIQAADATGALAALGAHSGPVHLLLTDVVLPGTGGRPLADRILELRPEMNVLFASGYSDDVILQHRLTARGAILLHKPFTADALVRKVREALVGSGRA